MKRIKINKTTKIETTNRKTTEKEKEMGFKKGRKR